MHLQLWTDLPSKSDQSPSWAGTGGLRLRQGQMGHSLQFTATDQQSWDAPTEHLAALPQYASWVWTDGSAEAGVLNGGARAFIRWTDGEEHELRRTAAASALASAPRWSPSERRCGSSATTRRTPRHYPTVGAILLQPRRGKALRLHRPGSLFRHPSVGSVLTLL